MTHKHLEIQYTEYNSLQDLSVDFQELYERAKRATEHAYAPYSQFKVGAAILMDNGEIITGSNQENVAYPSGLCAERTAIFYVGSTQHGNIKAIAVAATKDSISHFIEDISPCGGCRQVMVEYENKQDRNIQFIMPAKDGRFIVLDSVKALLPFEFTKDLLEG